MKALGVNENNDIYLGPDGNLAIVSDLQAVMQACAQAAKAQYGEMVFAVDEGVPNFQTVWQNTSNVAQFSAFLRTALEQVEGVTEVTSLNVTVSNNVLSYVATIKTIYGEGALDANV